MWSANVPRTPRRAKPRAVDPSCFKVDLLMRLSPVPHVPSRAFAPTHPPLIAAAGSR